MLFRKLKAPLTISVTSAPKSVYTPCYKWLDRVLCTAINSRLRTRLRINIHSNCDTRLEEIGQTDPSTV